MTQGTLCAPALLTSPVMTSSGSTSFCSESAIQVSLACGCSADLTPHVASLAFTSLYFTSMSLLAEDRPSGKAVHYSPGMHLRLKAYVYQLNEDGPTKDSAGGGEEGEGGGSTEMAAQYTQWQLPAKDLDGLWER